MTRRNESKVIFFVVGSILVSISVIVFAATWPSFEWAWITGGLSTTSSSAILKTKTKVFNVTHVPPRIKKGEFEKLDNLEGGLSLARVAIIQAARNKSLSNGYDDPDYVPLGELYRNPRVFHRSYLLMEKLFKVFVYQEGEPPLFHGGPCKNIYSMEGLFLHFMEVDQRYRTTDPDAAHVYFLPFSVVMILEYLFHPVIRDKAVLGRIISDYVRIISQKYPYWNRSLGADHFMLSCHDWVTFGYTTSFALVHFPSIITTCKLLQGPRATWYVPQLYFNSIRVLCNANTSERFNPRKDASFPEINLVTGETKGIIGGAAPPSSRSILAFFAGRLHGKIRPALVGHWKDKDDDIRVYEFLPQGVSYQDMMNKSKYCICPSGHEVASPRIVEAIYAECVPVLISQHYVLPFSDVLNWDSFSIQISVIDIPNLKNILMQIPQHRYLKMQETVKQVQRHFVVNDPPKRYDVFHMIMHSVWLRRLNVQISA